MELQTLKGLSRVQTTKTILGISASDARWWGRNSPVNGLKEQQCLKRILVNTTAELERATTTI